MWFIGDRFTKRKNDETNERLSFEEFACNLSPDNARRWLKLYDTSKSTSNKVITTKNTHYEIMSADRTMASKVYIDIDMNRSNAGFDPPSAREINDATVIVKRQLDKLIDALKVLVADFLSSSDIDVSYVLATRHRAKKLSFRVFVQGVYVQNYWAIPELLQSLLPDDTDREHWDMSPYSKSEQLLAAINSFKTRDDVYESANRLVMEREDDDVLLYTAQWVPDGWVCVATPIGDVQGNVQGVVHGVQAAVQGVKQTCSNPDYVPRHDLEFVKAILACLDETWYGVNSYANWLKVGMALCNCYSESKEQSDESEEAYLEAWIAFSKQAREYMREADRACRDKWRTFNEFYAGPKVTLGTLCVAAKATQPAAYKAAVERLKLRLRAISSMSISDGLRSNERFIHAKLVERWPERFVHLNAETFSVTKVNGPLVNNKTACAKKKNNAFAFAILEFRDATSGMSGKIFPDYSVAVDGDDDHLEGELVGELAPGLGISRLSRLHKDIDHMMQFNYSRDVATDLATLQGTGQHHYTSITIDRPYTGEPSGQVIIKGASSTLTKDKTRWLLQEIITKSGPHAQSILGPQAGSIFNNCTINNNLTINLDPDATRHSDEDLAQVIVKASPDIIERMRLVPDLKSNNCNGLYYCDPKTNVWSLEPNAAIEQLILKAFEPLKDDLTPADRRHVQSRRGRGDILYAIATTRIDKTFRDRLDANLDVFAVDNGVFDSSPNSPVFRPLAMGDELSVTAGWSYDAAKAVEHRAELETFLARIFPIDDERRVVLAFFASLLSGRRSIKRFLAFTDRRAGNNGKSTFSNLMTRFFGAYTEKSTKFVCKGSFSHDKDSHDAGYEQMRAKRLLIAEELKHSMTLDDAMLKSLSGGADNVIRGRRLGKDERFSFVWQAGIVLIFNEGDCPKFDTGDEAFMERMVVVPFRSKFVASQVGESDDDYTYLMDKTIDKKFNDWLPALADVLMDHADPNALDTLPPAMREWRQGVVTDVNPIAEWLLQNIEVTGNTDDVITIPQLKALHGKNDEAFGRNAKSYFRTIAHMGVSLNEVAKINGKCCRGVIKGARFKRLVEEENEFISI